MPRACLAAIRRVLWLEDEIASCPSEDLETLDGAMRVLEAAYVTLEQTALRAPRAHPLRVASLRMVGARRTWLAVAAEARPGVEDLEREATVELDAARLALRRVHGEEDARARQDGGTRDGDAGSNVVSLAARRARRTS